MVDGQNAGCKAILYMQIVVCTLAFVCTKCAHH